MSVRRILVVDDDPLSREFLTEAVQSMGRNAVAAESGAEALNRLEAEPFDMVLTDLRMNGMDGLELVRRLTRTCSDLPVAVVTAHGTIEAAVEAMQEGASDFVLKPTSPDALRMVVDRIEHTQRLEAENDYLRGEVGKELDTPMIAESDELATVLKSAARIAPSKGTVLITGESGTGKERVAQFIHQASTRATAPFIRVNCAALSETLLESELFGHERGAFTGAHRRRPGRFELADGGTLLLDELGEISANMQSKLLRVLQEDEFERVGGSTTLSVDVRVIAATNRDLAAEVAAGRFREDLYYRLHVLPLHVPPLRERLADVLPLAEHFAALHARRNGLPVPSIHPDARERLIQWDWPGNVRELENVVQRAVLLGKEGRVTVADLLFGPGQTAPTSAAADLALEDRDVAMAMANNTMADVERVAILATLECTGGNKTEAARRLGLTARTLSNKMKIWRQAGLVA